jgi:hypothetical protein
MLVVLTTGIRLRLAIMRGRLPLKMIGYFLVMPLTVIGLGITVTVAVAGSTKIGKK